MKFWLDTIAFRGLVGPRERGPKRNHFLSLMFFYSTPICHFHLRDPRGCVLYLDYPWGMCPTILANGSQEAVVNRRRTQKNSPGHGGESV